MNVILSKAKDPTVGTRVCCDQVKINEAKVIGGSVKILSRIKDPSLRSG